MSVLLGINRNILFHNLGNRSIFNLAKAAEKLSHSKDKYPNSQKYTIVKKFAQPQHLVYKLISRVDLYHEFIPYCTSSFITEKDSKTNEPTIAGLRVGFQSFDEEFSCNLNCKKPELVVAESITHSLFEILETEWKISPIDETSCSAVLNLKYEFKSSLYNHVSSLFAKKVANLMTKSFEKRAHEVSNSLILLDKYESHTR